VCAVYNRKIQNKLRFFTFETIDHLGGASGSELHPHPDRMRSSLHGRADDRKPSPQPQRANRGKFNSFHGRTDKGYLV